MGLAHGVTTKWQATKGIVQDGLVLNIDAGVKDSYIGSGTSWKDLSVGNDATLANGPVFDKSLGGRITLDGTNDRIDIPSISFAASGFTYSFVANLSSSTGQNYPRIIAGDKEIEWIRHSNSHALRWRWQGSSPANSDSSANYFIQDEIHIYTITYASPDVKLYRDGTLFQTLSSTPSSSCSFNTMLNRSNSARPVAGDAYQCLLYSRALTAAEVSRNFNVMRHRFGI